MRRVIQRWESMAAFGNAVVTADIFSLASAKKIAAVNISWNEKLYSDIAFICPFAFFLTGVTIFYFVFVV